MKNYESLCDSSNANWVQIKKYPIFMLLIVVIFSCKSDNFYDTERVLETNKTAYVLGEQINLTLKIIPYKGQKEIRMFENFKNLEISFALINRNENRFNAEWSEPSGRFLPDTTIETIIISPEKPFLKTFVGQITDKADSVQIHFPELKTQVKFSKEKLKTDTIRIHGLCIPIAPDPGASYEEFFEVNDIKIHVQ